ncbi:MAG TPA: hypothetical protein VGW36_06490 [Pyrinomonadaceae bacterium]|nr:hypothetical protein [Pyrinomonadaceae bacterium]
MKNFRGFALGLALGLAAAISTVGIAQNTKQGEQSPKAESCCAMESCCCKGDSCPMDHKAMGQDMKEHSKTHSSDHGCCCCGGDSCNMKMKEHKQE